MNIKIYMTRVLLESYEQELDAMESGNILQNVLSVMLEFDDCVNM